MYLDSSIIVKLLLNEPDSAFYKDALSGSLISTSELAVTEVWAALLAKERRNDIYKSERQEAWAEFSNWIQLERILIHPLESAVLKRTHHILQICHPAVPLRSLDAIHTAACDLSQDFPLCTTDKRMRDAANILHIPVFPE